MILHMLHKLWFLISLHEHRKISGSNENAGMQNAEPSICKEMENAWKNCIGGKSETAWKRATKCRRVKCGTEVSSAENVLYVTYVIDALDSSNIVYDLNLYEMYRMTC